jgi:hypothetical protein
MWSAVASEALHRFGIGGRDRVSQSAVAAALCRRTPNAGTSKMRLIGSPLEFSICVGVTAFVDSASGWRDGRVAEGGGSMTYFMANRGRRFATTLRLHSVPVEQNRLRRASSLKQSLHKQCDGIRARYMFARLSFGVECLNADASLDCNLQRKPSDDFSV